MEAGGSDLTMIRIDGLSVSFGETPVIDGVSLEIPPGGPTFLLGRSGSGKTTLLRAINRLNECFPGCRTRGSVSAMLDGAWRDVYAPDMRVEELRRRVGMVFQSPNALPVSVARNIALPLRTAQHVTKHECEERIEQALREVHLWDEVKNRLAAPAATLSGGQQQRLCLARALALRPEILLLDEPTASLDFKSARQVEELLAELAARYTVVVVSHSLSQAHRLAAEVFVLRQGGRIERLPEAVFRDKESLFAALDELG